MSESFIWIFVTLSVLGVLCSIAGMHLFVRSQLMLADALSHAVLPGIVLSFLFLGSWNSQYFFVGAILAALCSTFLISILNKKWGLQEDSAIGVVYTSLFALGILLIQIFASRVHIDIEHVLMGELLFVAIDEKVSFLGFLLPQSLAFVFLSSFILLTLFYLFERNFKTLAFDLLSASLRGYKIWILEFVLNFLVTFTIVVSFRMMGAIMVLSFLSFPVALASLFFNSFGSIKRFMLVFVLLVAWIGLNASFAFDLNPAASVSSLMFLVFVVSLILKNIFFYLNSKRKFKLKYEVA